MAASVRWPRWVFEFGVLSTSLTLSAHWSPSASMAPMPNAADGMLAGSAAVKAWVPCAWMRALGWNPTPVTDWLPVTVAMVQSSTFAETSGPPITM